MLEDQERDILTESLDASIAAFNKDGRLARGRATRRARRLTGMDWTYSALLILEGMKDNDNLRMSQLAEYVGTTPPTVTKLVRELENRGLITRRPDADDGRASILSLTGEGRRVAERIGRARLEGLREVVANWSEADLLIFTTLFERLRADMRRMS
jgi:DNA-binding MarR family transcriptional regulator